MEGDTMEREKIPSVILRAVEPEDLDFMYIIENDRDIWKVGNTNMPYSRFALHEYIANSTGDIYVDKQLRLITDEDKLAYRYHRPLQFQSSASACRGRHCHQTTISLPRLWQGCSIENDGLCT